MDHTKQLDQADLDPPCQELLVRDLGFVVALLFCSGIFCVHLLEVQPSGNLPKRLLLALHRINKEREITIFTMQCSTT